ncbi:MAG UNVERIFIED_CONTAM: hypothetical protein LVR18_39930 [Planctomycetaceae bacterium]
MVKQYKEVKANPNKSGFIAAFTSPMLISGSADIYTTYASYTLKGNISFKLDTQGRFMAGGKLIFFYGLLTTSAKLYADLSQVSQGNAKILLLADFPDQVTLYTIKGKRLRRSTSRQTELLRRMTPASRSLIPASLSPHRFSQPPVVKSG